MEEQSLQIIHNIGLSIIFAAVLAFVARLLKQPLLLGYIAGGIALGPHLGFGLIKDEASVEVISEMGLIMLLFIIGLEIRLPDLQKLGKELFILGVLQFVGCVALGLLLLRYFDSAQGRFDALYLAIAGSLSSTLIVVKLLQQKFELKSTAGRITVGLLVIQDLWAILFMGIQPNLTNPGVKTALLSVGGVIGLVLASFLISRFILGRLFQAAASSPELVLITAAAWCFSVAGFAEWAGLSLEMGALVSGLAIAAFPYGHDVISKLSGVRDFFITLFFVALGLKVAAPTLETAVIAVLLIAFVYLSRFLTIAPTTIFTGSGLRAGINTALNLSQISEFSLVILALGVGYGHISGELSNLVLTAMLLASVASTYTIMFSGGITRGLLKVCAVFGIRETGAAAEGAASAGGHGHGGERRDIVVLGAYRIAQGFLDRIEREAPALIPRILVVDYNPALREGLEARGFHWVYGDLAHPESLQHSGVEDAELVICTISDVFLKGVTNERLLAQLKQLAPTARFVMTADDPVEAEALKQAGAVHVVVPGKIAGHSLFDQLRWDLAGSPREAN